MLWYGLGFLYILLTMMSYMIDGQRGFGSTTLTQHISASAQIIIVSSREGFGDSGMLYIGDEAIRYESVTERDGGAQFYAPNGRGALDTNASAHHAGARIYSETTEALNEAIGFQVAETNSVWGIVQYPFQAVGFFSKFVAKVITWDYQYLNSGYGWYFKLVFLYPLNILVAFSLINVFKDALSILGLRR